MASKIKSILIGILLSLFSLVIMYLLGEAYIRIFDPQPVMPKYVTDSGFGTRVFTPNTKTHHTTPDFKVEVRSNSLGMRSDRDIPFEKPDDVFRILLLGDSFTFGYGVNLEDSYPYLIEKNLQAEGINAEVVNLGVADYGTGEELVMLNNRGLKFDPDLVVVGYWINDIRDNEAAMLYSLEDSILVRKNKKYLPAQKLRDRLYSIPLYSFLAERSQFLYFIRMQINQIVLTRAWKRNHKELVDEKKDLTEQYITVTDKGKKLTARLLDEIKLTCKRDSIPFCLMDFVQESFKVPNTFASNLPYEYLREITEDEIISTDAKFHEAAPQTQLFWRRSMGHWTPDGHIIVANLLKEHIIARFPSLKEDYPIATTN